MNTFLQTAFGFKNAEIKKLSGYANANYLIIANTKKYILKTYTYTEELWRFIKAETDTLLSLQDTNTLTFPKPIPFLDGSFYKIENLNGNKTICRLLTFLEGTFLGDSTHNDKLIESLGTFLAQTDVQLGQFTNDTIKARQWEWDIQYLHLNKKYIDDISDTANKNVVRYFFQQFEENVVPILPTLRKQLIHNDFNDWNVLTHKNTVTGIIDFGDLAHSPLINELAIAITYICFDKENPLKWATTLVTAYHKVLPLKEIEIRVLYYLIAARLIQSVCNAAHAKKITPENTYASVSEKAAWKLLYQWIRINPIAAENTFKTALGFSVIKPPSIAALLKKRHQHISTVLSLSYQTPIYMVRAAFQYMYDGYGATFLDAYNNIPHVGHSHPKVVEAGQKQLATLNTNTRYLYDLLPRYAEKLLAKFPRTLNKVFFVNSGSAASDLAIRIALTHTKHKKILVMEHGYHGHTQMATDISDYKFNNPKGQGQKDYILKTALPDTYRGKYTTNNGSAGKQYAQEAITQLENLNTPIAAFISEPIVGCAGQVPLAKGYLKELYPAIRKQGGVCISDEVQTGFGRLGTHFWGFEAQEVVPDMVIVGKPMGNGHPLGAVITTSEIADSFSKGVEFFSSFGGNPVSCAIGLSVLEVIEDEKLQENARVVGAYYKSLFFELQKKYTCIGDIRGSGLFLGVEIVKKDSIEPDTALAQHIKNELRHKNILISTDGPFDSVLKTKPPLCFTKKNALEVVSTIENVLCVCKF